MDKDATLILLRKLLEDKLTVLCIGELVGLKFLVKGEVSEVDLDTNLVTIVSPGSTGIRFSLAEGEMAFAYNEPREFPDIAEQLSEESRSAMALIISFLGPKQFGRIYVMQVLS